MELDYDELVEFLNIQIIKCEKDGDLSMKSAYCKVLYHIEQVKY